MLLLKTTFLISLISLSHFLAGQDIKPSTRDLTIKTDINIPVEHDTKQFRIKQTSSRTLPADLKDEIILFLKFDSVDVPLKRPKGYAKSKFIKYTNHNKMVPDLNKELRQIAAKYPFRYKIISMMDKNYAGHGAKYLLWMNTFDAFTDGVVYSSGTHREGFGANAIYSSNGEEGPALGIVDLKTKKKYLISWRLGMSRTYMYREMIGMLNNTIKKQFN